MLRWRPLDHQVQRVPLAMLIWFQSDFASRREEERKCISNDPSGVHFPLPSWVAGVHVDGVSTAVRCV
jgi:hypothetical protein